MEQLIIRESRKAFLLEYLAAAFIVLLMIFFKAKEIDIPEIGYYLLSFAAIFAVLLPEIIIIRQKFIVDDKYIIHKKGILTKNTKSIHATSFTDVDLEQTLFQQIFNYGDLVLRTFSPSKYMKVENVSKPHKVSSRIEHCIHKALKGTQEQPKPSS